jgi:hypothetical protein
MLSFAGFITIRFTTVTLTFHALWLLCGFGTAVFAAAPGDRSGRSPAARFRRASISWTTLAIGFALLAAFLRGSRTVDAAWLAGLVAVVAAWQLVHPRQQLIVHAAAGALAAAWATLLTLEGLPSPLALVVAALVPVVSHAFARRSPGFADPVVHEEAMVGLFLLALIVAAAPAVAQGWQAALALNLTDKSTPTPLLPVWTMSLIGGSMAVGGMWTLWRRG